MQNTNSVFRVAVPGGTVRNVLAVAGLLLGIPVFAFAQNPKTLQHKSDSVVAGQWARSQAVPKAEEFFVQTKSSLSVDRLADAVAPLGKIESRGRGSSIYLIKLRPGIEDDRAKGRLAKLPGVHVLDADEEPVDMNSVQSLDRKISHLMKPEPDGGNEKKERVKKADEPAKSGKPGKLGRKLETPGESEDDEKVDYLRARRYFLNRRAYPNDTVDWSALERGQLHAAKMQSASVGKSTPGQMRPASNQWTFMGPTNLQVPYNPYYGVGAINGRVNAVAYDPNNSQTIYAGGAQGGLFKSTDGGTTWVWLSSSWTQLAVN